MKKLKFISLSTVSMMLFGAVSCSSDTPEPTPPGNENPGSQVTEISPAALQTAKGFNDFAFNLLAESVKAERDENANVVLSPLSMSMTLAMLANGADGATLTQITDALAATGINLNDLNARCGELLNAYARLAESKVSVVNSLWLDSKFPVADSYVKDIASLYGADVKLMSPLCSSRATSDINAYVNNATFGKIPQLLDPGILLENFAVVNALYLNTKWADTFSAGHFYDFTGADGKRTNTEFINSSTYADYVETESAGSVTLDLYDGFCMTIMLPKNGVKPASLVAGLSTESLLSMGLGQSQSCNVTIPKLNLEYSMNEGAKILAAMGITDLFDDSKVNLSRLCTGNMSALSVMLQKTKFDLDEKGIEAAAATIGGSFGFNGESSKPKEFKADRPFGFVVWHKPTASVFFNGVVNRID